MLPKRRHRDVMRQHSQSCRIFANAIPHRSEIGCKEVGGGASAVLEAKEKLLVVFETLVVEAMEVPKVKRSSVGSISSVASNLSMHPTTEAIVFKDTLQDMNAAPSTLVSSTMQRKVFVFLKNAMVAEVIELGLERFVILEGVVDGGDEVER